MVIRTEQVERLHCGLCLFATEPVIIDAKADGSARQLGHEVAVSCGALPLLSVSRFHWASQPHGILPGLHPHVLEDNSTWELKTGTNSLAVLMRLLPQ